MLDCVKGIGCTLPCYIALMAHSYAVLTSSGPVTFGLRLMFANVDFGPKKNDLDGHGFPECNLYIFGSQ